MNRQVDRQWKSVLEGVRVLLSRAVSNVEMNAIRQVVQRYVMQNRRIEAAAGAAITTPTVQDALDLAFEQLGVSATDYRRTGIQLSLNQFPMAHDMREVTPADLARGVAPLATEQRAEIPLAIVTRQVMRFLPVRGPYSQGDVTAACVRAHVTKRVDQVAVELDLQDAGLMQ